MFQLEEKYVTGDLARTYIDEVVDVTYHVVTDTMSPDGKVVVYQDGTAVASTKDGATVARSLEFANPHKDKILQIIAEAAVKTEAECGDGTTTTIFLTKHLYDLYKQFPGFRNAVVIDKLIDDVIEELKRKSISVKRGDPVLRQLAMITANQDTSIVDTVLKVYDDYESPYFQLTFGSGSKDVITKTQGQLLRMRFASPIFSQDKNGGITELKDMMFVVVNNDLTADMVRDPNAVAVLIQETLRRYPGKNIGLVASRVDTQFAAVVASINYDMDRAQLNDFGRASVFMTNTGGSIGGLIMGDIASVLNAPVLNAFTELGKVELHPFEETLSASMESTIVLNVGPATAARIASRAKDIEATMESLSHNDRFSPLGRATIRRLHEIKGQVVKVLVGGETVTDVKERKDRFDDVILAVNSALLNGVLPGAGVALRDASNAVVGGPIFVSPEGIKPALAKVLTAQWVKLVNAYNPDLPYDHIVNLATGDVGTPAELGVYDTAYASISALKGAKTIAKMLANTGSIVLGGRLNAVNF